MRSSGSRQKWPVATLEQEVHGIALLLHQMARVLNAADLGELAWPGLQDRSFRSTADILHVSIVAAALHHRVMSGAIYGCHAGADGCMNARFSNFLRSRCFSSGSGQTCHHAAHCACDVFRRQLL